MGSEWLAVGPLDRYRDADIAAVISALHHTMPALDHGAQRISVSICAALCGALAERDAAWIEDYANQFAAIEAAAQEEK